MSTRSENVSPQVVNVPNVLTALRLLLAMVVFALIAVQYFLPALVLFVAAAATDWIDGYWARRFGQVTQLGRMFDPFVDKIIICGTFIFLVAQAGSGITAWVAVVVVGRELLVTALRSYLESQGVDFSASMSGKLKMVFQCAAAVASLLALMLGQPESQTVWFGTATGLPQWLYLSLLAAVWLTVISTIQSGVEYIVKAAAIMRR